MNEVCRLPLEFVMHYSVFLSPELVIYSPVEEDLLIVQTLFRHYQQYFPWEICSVQDFHLRVKNAYDLPEETFTALAGNSALTRGLLTADEDEALFLNNDEAPVIRLIDRMIEEAIQARASDIHIAGNRHNLSIRFRIDGWLKEVTSSDAKLASPLISRLKIMAGLDIAEKRLPQDGKILFSSGGQEIDIRISVVPSIEGERVVLRLLLKDAAILSLSSFDMAGDMRSELQRMIRQPHGMILVTGPTGSGKSTTLYAFLNEINTPEKNILTIEDPVEFYLDNVGQTQVNVKNGFTFAKGLRALLRQDPDVVMIGEIRDNETAAIAVQSALTGHLVFSTLHTNTAVGAITRLRDMSVEPYLIGSVLTGVVSQRLVRILCPHCKKAVRLAGHLAMPGFDIGDTIFEPVGCPKCHHQGFRGRTAIFEFMPVNNKVKEMIYRCAAESEITTLLQLDQKGILADGVDKVRRGIIAWSELLRVTTL